MTNEERREIEKRLQEERERALEALAAFDRTRDLSLQEQSGELSVHRFHMADVGTEAMEREKEFLLASQEGEQLYRIDEALRRLYSDPEGFGICERCGAAIEMERLALIPFATHCAECQREVEK